MLYSNKYKTTIILLLCNIYTLYHHKFVILLNNNILIFYNQLYILIKYI